VSEVSGIATRLVLVDSLMPRPADVAGRQGCLAETADARGVGRTLSKVEMSAANAEQRHQVVDQLLGQPRRIQDASDRRGDRPDGLHLPQMEALIEPGFLELLSELGGTKAEPHQAENRLVDTLRLQQAHHPRPLVVAERHLGPAVGRVLQLRRHGARPPRDHPTATAQHAGARAGLLDDRLQELLGNLGS